ncbi:MAG TPA: hypothetical protein VEZ72_20440 [Paenibacillus sp.]|nr:hypothetical protein [Paenibacillus sp.]
MKVTFQGNMSGEAKVRREGGSRSRPSSRTIRALKKEIRKGVRRIRRELKRQRRELRSDLRRDFRREMYSDRFASFVRSAVVGGAAIRDIAEGLVNEAVRAQTPAGPVSGTLVEVGEDYMTIRETPSTILIVPFRSVESVRPL